MLKLTLVSVMVLAAACTRTDTAPTTVTTSPQPSTTFPPSPPTTEPLPSVESAADLREALLALGYTIADGGRAKTLFTGDYRSWDVSGELMRVWEYPTEAAHRKDWDQFLYASWPLDPGVYLDFVDGQRMFWASGRTIVFYVFFSGGNPAFADELTGLLGEPVEGPSERREVFKPWAGTQWFDPDGELVPWEEDIISVFVGPDHCGWQNAVFLHVGWPVGTPPEPKNLDETTRQYIRLGDIVVGGDRFTTTFHPDVALPSDAEFTGYTNEVGMELWLAPSDQDQSAYLVFQTHVERWPRADPLALCS